MIIELKCPNCSDKITRYFYPDQYTIKMGEIEEEFDCLQCGNKIVVTMNIEAKLKEEIQ